MSRGGSRGNGAAADLRAAAPKWPMPPESAAGGVRVGRGSRHGLKRGSGDSSPRRPVRLRRDALLRRVFAQAEAAFMRFDAVAEAPARDERARDRRVEKVDGERVIHDPAQARGRHGPVAGAAIRIEPRRQVIELAAEPFRRHGDADTRRGNYILD